MKVRTPSSWYSCFEMKLRTSIYRGLNTELIVNSTVANEWEVLSYDFTSQPSDLYDRVVIIFDKIPGQIGDGSRCQPIILMISSF